jgi:phosphotransferase system enzyme I (PtsP)
MVAEVAEFVRAKQLVDLELNRLKKFGRSTPTKVEVGTMLEVPALVWQMEALLPLVDFVSIGSNDLLQFLYASDRGNPRVANRYDLLSPGALNFLRQVVSVCARHDVPLALCGEMAGRPLEAMALLGLGLRRISMSPAAVGPVKMMVRSLDVGHLSEFMKGLYERPDASVREHLQAYADEQGIAI